ncbi:nucleoside deaminase [Virgibacillus sp. C22-A2]|uniref:Nucleoside deaminase n=1 Tax=Virgibacillus tibetensis TaxID=3042313 RepID=A0ABU6KHA6_9BACI|nr:nucleoside deaminase [Virgibacillus sp. C22-A2]
MNEFMSRAVELAVDNVKQGGQPFGAVLVKGNVAVSEGVNELHLEYDISGHAELLAMRKAQKDYQTNDLSEFSMYASGEPCPMCLTAMYFAGLKEVYYCATIEETAEAGLGKSREIYEDLRKVKQERKLQMVRMPLQEGQPNPMKIWGERN